MSHHAVGVQVINLSFGVFLVGTREFSFKMMMITMMMIVTYDDDDDADDADDEDAGWGQTNKHIGFVGLSCTHRACVCIT